MSGTAKPFSFVHGDRTYTCSVETSRTASRGAWWWFSVSTEAHQRHAPFPALPGDTKADVQARIIAFYEAMLVKRAEPAQNRWQQRGQRPAAAAPAAAAATPAS